MKYREILVCLVLLGLASCAEQTDKSQKNTEARADLFASDGTKLSYTDSGSGDSSLVFIHGWNIDQSYWDQQVAYFSPRYRVVTITLPGYGGTKPHPEGCSPEIYAKDIAVLIDSLDLDHAVLIGHSMSGAMIAATAAMRPKKTAGIIGIDNFTGYGFKPSPEEKKAIAAVYTEMREHYSRVMKEYTNQYLFSPSTDSASRNRILNSFLSADSTFSVDCLEQLEEYPLDSLLLSLHRPLYLVNSDFHPNDTASFRNAGIELHFYNVGSTGHYPMIETPEQFNQLLAKAISDMSANK